MIPPDIKALDSFPPHVYLPEPESIIKEISSLPGGELTVVEW